MTAKGGVVVRTTGRDPHGNPCAVEWHDGVHDIGRRVREGDELWRGDPTMELLAVFPLDPSVPPLERPFQVWATDAHGERYMVLSAERCDHDILRRLTEGDWQRGKARSMALVVAEQARLARIEAEAADRQAETIDRLGWAIRKDLHGTRRVFGQVGKGKV